MKSPSSTFSSKGSKETGRFLLNLALVCLLVIIGQAGLTAITGVPPKPRRPDLNIQAVDRGIAAEPDVFYIGDSTLIVLGNDDRCADTSPEMLRNELPEYTVCDFAMPGLHADVCRALISHGLRTGHKPGLFIICVNLRSFCPGWYLNPNLQWRELQLYSDYDNALFQVMYHPLAVLGVLDWNLATTADCVASIREVVGGQNAALEQYVLGAKKPTDDVENVVRDLMRLRYTQRIDDSHPRLRSLCETVSIAKKKGAKVLCYVTPVDYELGERLVGSGFSEPIRNNVRTILSALEGEGSEVMDLSELLGADCFVEEDLATEHIKDEGRLAVTKALAERVRELLGPKASEPDVAMRETTESLASRDR